MSNEIAIDDATAADLRAFAETHHGLEIKPRSNRVQILAALAGAGVQLGETIPRLVAQAHPDAEAFGKQQAMPADIAKAERVTILIAKVKGGIDPVPVGVNGYFISIRRGVKVSIPRPHYEVLVQHATEYEYPTDDNGQIIGDPVEIPRFPVQTFAAA